MEETMHGSSSLKCRKIVDSFEYARKDVCVNAVKRLLGRARLGMLTSEDIYDEIALVEASLLIVLPGEDEKLFMNDENVCFENELLVRPTVELLKGFAEIAEAKETTVTSTCEASR